MTKIKEIIGYKKEAGIHKWVFDTTRSNLIGYKRNEKLQREISNWDIHKHFVEQYGLILNYPEDYLSILILSTFLKNYKILYHPDDQDDASSLIKLNLISNQVKWIYSTCINYDTEYINTITHEEFKNSGYSPPFMFSDLEKSMSKNPIKRIWYTLRFLKQIIKNYQLTSKIYELKNSNEIHQAVSCGGNSDAFKCPNYLILKSRDTQFELLQILSQPNKPTLDEVLNACEFLIFDFKGEDIGYARQLMIYSKNKHSNMIDEIVTCFENFANEMKFNLEECETLNEYEKRTADLLKKYGC